MSKKFYVTTPIYYPNGKPHIGHAYNAIATDAFARFERLAGKDVFFLSGTDEHGLKMQKTAIEAGITPQELADKNSAVFKQMLKTLNCTNDRFIRTTEKAHHESCQALWKRMEENGDIYLGHYKGWYSVRQEAYYDEKDTIIGEDGIRREKEVGSPVEWNEEESYFFRLSKYQQALLDLYEKQEDFIRPKERRNEIISFVKSGLKDISISRATFNWGIPVPNDEKHVMYVWVDALTNYLTGAGYPNMDTEQWEYWPADLHVIGKDIIRFHAIFWPAFLMSAKIPLPKSIFAHGFLLNKGEKMSKSVGNVVDVFSLVQTYGLDQVRYFLLREVPFGQDGSYSHTLIVNRINSDLANDLGNLAQRSLSIVEKNCQGVIPKAAGFLPQDQALLDQIPLCLQEMQNFMRKQAPHMALATIFTLISNANKYFAGQEPWAVRKTDAARFGTILYVTLETLRCIAIMLLPFIPNSAHKLLDLLAVEKNARCFTCISEGDVTSSSVLPKPFAIFPRYITQEDEIADAH